MPTIGVLFIAIDGLPFAPIWQRWASTDVRRVVYLLSESHSALCTRCLPPFASQVPHGWSVRFWVHAKEPELIRTEAGFVAEDAGVSDDETSPSLADAMDPWAPLAACCHHVAVQRWVAHRLLPVTFRPKRGSIELVLAALELLKQAIADDPTVEWLILASESCLPVVSLSEVRKVVAVRGVAVRL
jgi:hypothetical protein